MNTKTGPTRPTFTEKQKVGELTFLLAALKRLHTEGKIFLLRNEEMRGYRYAVLGEKPEMHSPAGGYILRLRDLVECKHDIISDDDLAAILAAGKMYADAGEEIAAGIRNKMLHWKKVSPGQIRHVLRNIQARYRGRQTFYSGAQGLGRQARTA